MSVRGLSRITLVVAACVMVVAPRVTYAIQPPAEDPARSIDWSSLPRPPSPIAKLIEVGDVRLVTGGQPQSTLDPLIGTGRLAGETRFNFRYKYDSRARWQRDRSDRTAVRVSVRFRTLKLITQHEVWLRDVPSKDEFWSDRVVLHEFDHVRISCDPRITQFFLDLVNDLKSFSVPQSELRDARGMITHAQVQTLVDERMKSLVQRATDYVRIRYRELDRVTRHGIHPIPTGHELFRSESNRFVIESKEATDRPGSRRSPGSDAPGIP